MSHTEGDADAVVYQAPEIQTMYSVPQPVSAIRSRIRQEFERNRFVNKLPVVDVLLLQSNADYQVRQIISTSCADVEGLAGRTSSRRKHRTRVRLKQRRLMRG